MLTRRKQRIAMNILVIAAFLILGGLVVTQSLTSSSAPVSASVPAVAPTNNPIVEENQKPGSDKWKSPNQDDYLKNMIDDQKGRMEGTRSPADR